jgi:hypothetical protein
MAHVIGWGVGTGKPGLIFGGTELTDVRRVGNCGVACSAQKKQKGRKRKTNKIGDKEKGRTSA